MMLLPTSFAEGVVFAWRVCLLELWPKNVHKVTLDQKKYSHKFLEYLS